MTRQRLYGGIGSAEKGKNLILSCGVMKWFFDGHKAALLTFLSIIAARIPKVK